MEEIVIRRLKQNYYVGEIMNSNGIVSLDVYGTLTDILRLSRRVGLVAYYFYSTGELRLVKDYSH